MTLWLTCLVTEQCSDQLSMQEEARRLAEQVHALEEARSRWGAEVAAKEASLAAKEEALAADNRQRDADQRRRLAHEHQVCLCICSETILTECHCKRVLRRCH